MNVGYVRCSTVEQNEERQLRMMAERGIDPAHIFTDKASGKNTDRPAFHKMMNYVREGDTVIVESISRIARNTRDLLGIVEQLTAKGVEFVSIKESIDTTTPQGKFMLTVFGALAELERENILERQREGIAIAKEQGKYKGRKPIDADPEQLAAVCARWFLYLDKDEIAAFLPLLPLIKDLLPEEIIGGPMGPMITSLLEMLASSLQQTKTLELGMMLSKQKEIQ